MTRVSQYEATKDVMVIKPEGEEYGNIYDFVNITNKNCRELPINKGITGWNRKFVCGIMGSDE